MKFWYLVAFLCLGYLGGATMGSYYPMDASQLLMFAIIMTINVVIVAKLEPIVRKWL